MTAIKLHARERRSRANGPGVRFVIWFQGCSLGCPGCFNPQTHSTTSGEIRSVDELVAEIIAEGAAIEGITLSGGEPMEQPEAALELVRAVRRRTGLSILMFSGYTIDEIREHAAGAAILSHLDVLVDGRYMAPQRLGKRLRGSRNQNIHLLSGRYELEHIEATPEAEIRIDPDGNVILTGVDPLIMK